MRCPRSSCRRGRSSTRTPVARGRSSVLVHGLAMDGRQWRKVDRRAAPGHRCVTPVLPMGAHRDADARRRRPLAARDGRGSSPSSSRRLDLRDVTLCFNDWCGAQVMIADGLMDRVGKLVLVSCEAYDNYPPGLAGHAAWLSAQAARRDGDDAPGPPPQAAAQPALRLRPDDQARRPRRADARMAGAAEARRDPPRRRQVHGRRDERPARPGRGDRGAARLRPSRCSSSGTSRGR